MASYSSSVAYDLSAFQPAQKPQQKPRLKVVGKPVRKASSVLTPRVLGVFAIVVTLIGLIIYNQVCLTELTGDINKLQAELKILESENIKLTSQLESTVSLRTVAERARDELGLDRASKYQTEYVYLYSEDEIRSMQPGNASSEEGRLSVGSVFSRLQEYIRVK